MLEENTVILSHATDKKIFTLILIIYNKPTMNAQTASFDILLPLRVTRKLSGATRLAVDNDVNA
jgi:hypothetical protein